MQSSIKGQIKIIDQQMKELAGVYRGAISKSGMSENEFWIWYGLLVLDGEYSQQDLSDMWSLSRQTVNTIIGNLVKRGYVSLEVVPGTRNRKIIRLLPEGKKYGGSVVMPIFEAEVRAVGKLPEEERQACIMLLGKYIGLLKEELNESGIVQRSENCRQHGNI